LITLRVSALLGVGGLGVPSSYLSAMCMWCHHVWCALFAPAIAQSFTLAMQHGLTKRDDGNQPPLHKNTNHAPPPPPFLGYFFPPQDFETKLLEAESKRQQQQRPPPMQQQQQSPQGQEQQQQQEEQDGESGEEGQAGGMMEQQMEELTQEQLEQVGVLSVCVWGGESGEGVHTLGGWVSLLGGGGKLHTLEWGGVEVWGWGV